jgi:hypothetical protein
MSLFQQIGRIYHCNRARYSKRSLGKCSSLPYKALEHQYFLVTNALYHSPSEPEWYGVGSGFPVLAANLVGGIYPGIYDIYGPVRLLCQLVISLRRCNQSSFPRPAVSPGTKCVRRPKAGKDISALSRMASIFM